MAIFAEIMLWLSKSKPKISPMKQDMSLLLKVAKSDAPGALDIMQTSSEGLLDREAEELLRHHGLNIIAQEKPVSNWGLLFKYFTNPLILLLSVLALMSFYLGDVDAAVIISAMLGISIFLSFFQETRSTRASERLRAMVQTTATVIRRDPRTGVPEEVTRYFHIRLHPQGSKKQEVSIEYLVPGDLVQLSAGDMIPADLRILSAKDLFINQSSMTGEAIPVEKFSLRYQGVHENVLQLPNVCFMGTNVVSGTATGLVVQTGAKTYFGTLAQMVTHQTVQTDFDRGIKEFTWLMIRFILVMTPLVLLINGFSKHNWVEALSLAMAVAVGLTPEMLPMIVTVNLGKGALLMSRKKVIVKRLSAIQSFGAMDVLCTDKTGTLTQDKIILEKHLDINGTPNEAVLEYAYLNSYYQSGLKNLLDVAVLEYAGAYEKLRQGGGYHKIDEIPFDFQRRRMSVVVTDNQKHILICKGAVEEIFSCCTYATIDGKIKPLDKADAVKLQNVTLALNEDGFRVIAIAYKETSVDQHVYGVSDENNLILLGYIAFLDPPKDSAREAIFALNQQGVAIKILTGDNEIITQKICREVGLAVDHVLLGHEMEKLNDADLREQVERTVIFAKLSPAQKARVITLLQKNDHVVGFMGDGINDGPALKAADVGISVDTAVDIAKESADIILLEKSLMVLEEGVIEGRRVFGNIVKYIKMGASSNFGNMFSVVGASIWLPFLPMQAIQVLTNNMLYDFSQTTIPTDQVDDEYLAKPRRWNIANIKRFMWMMGPISSIFDYVTFFIMYFVFHANSIAQSALFQTGWFVESLLSQTLIIHIIRTSKIPFLQSRASVPLIITSVLICSIGVYLPYSPFNHQLGFVPLPKLFWIYLFFILVGYLSLTHWVKTIFVKRYGLN